MVNEIILASKSKVRKKILEDNKVVCRVEPSNVDEDSVPMNSKCTIGKQCCDTASNDRRRSSSRESRVTACVFVCVMHNIRYAVCNLTMSMLSHTFYCLMSYHTLVVRYP